MRAIWDLTGQLDLSGAPENDQEPGKDEPDGWRMLHDLDFLNLSAASPSNPAPHSVIAPGSGVG